MAYNNTTIKTPEWYLTQLDKAKEQGDYLKAANLLDEYKNIIDDREIRNQLSIQAGQLRSAYNKEQALFDNMKDPLATKAYYFKKAIETNTTPLDVRQHADSNDGYTNEYWEDYQAAIDAFGSDGDRMATSVNFKFDNKNYYKDFLDATGLTSQELSPTYNVDGTVYINVAKSNSNLFFKVLDGVNTLDDIAYVQRNGFFEDSSMSFLKKLTNPLTRAFRNFRNSETFEDYLSFAWKTGIGNAIGGGLGHMIFRDTFIEAQGITAENEKIKTFYSDAAIPAIGDSGLGYKALSVYYDAFRKVQDIERYSQENTYDIIALDFTTPAQAEALRRLNNGVMSEDDYKKWNNTEQDIINTALIGMPFSKADVFTDDEESDNLHAVKDEDKKALNRIFVDALRDGRVKTKAAIVGGDIGILCDILEKSSDKGSITGDEDSSYRGRRIFIKNMPNNLQNLLNESFNANSQYKALKEYSQLTAWGYEYETRNGDRINKVDNFGGMYKGKDDVDYTFKTRDEINKILNEDFAMNDIISGLNLEIARTVNSNKLGFSYKNGTDTMAARAAIALAKENGYIEGTNDYIETVKRLYDEILNGIDYTGPRGLILQTNTMNR